MRWGRILAWVAGALVALPIVLVLLVLGAANTDPGRRGLLSLVESVTGGTVRATGLSGRFPDRLRLETLEVSDVEGVWLRGDDIRLDWAPTALLGGRLRVDSATLESLDVRRLPVAAPEAVPPEPAPSSEPFSLPVRADIERLAIARLTLGPGVAAPTAAALSVEGALAGVSAEDFAVDATLQRLDAAGEYRLRASRGAEGVAVDLAVTEPEGGLVQQVGGVPALGDVTVTLGLNGPWQAAVLRLDAAAGALRAEAAGTLDLAAVAGELRVQANAPAMTPGPGVAWEAIALDATLGGSLTAPRGEGSLRLEGLVTPAARIAAAMLRFNADPVRARAEGQIDGLRLSGAEAGPFAEAPIRLEAELGLEAAERPLRFAITHPSLNLEGQGTLGETVTRIQAQLRLPELAALAPLAGVPLAGRLEAALGAEIDPTGTALTANGTVSLRDGPAPLPALLGAEAPFAIAARLANGDIAIREMSVTGARGSLGLDGAITGAGLDLNWRAALSELAVLVPNMAGAVQAEGTLRGPTDNFALAATVEGTVAPPGLDASPFTARLDASGLPGRPAGALRVEGALAGQPMDLSLAAVRRDDGGLAITLEPGRWGEASATGAATLDAGYAPRSARLAITVPNLADFAALAGQPLAGSLTAEAELDEQALVLSLAAEQARLGAQASIGRLTLAARVDEPFGAREVDARLVVADLVAGGTRGGATLEAKGPASALGLVLRAEAAGARVNARATLDLPQSQLALTGLEVDAQGETLRLRQPAEINFADGVVIQRLRLGLRSAALELDGRVLPTLDLTFALRDLPLALAEVAAPALALEGTLRAEGRLTGAPAQPNGRIRLAVNNARMREGTARALPPADLNATIDLAGTRATIDARATAGPNLDLTATGSVPLGMGLLDLAVRGNIGLQLLDPILTADGRQVRGRIALDARIEGPATAPRGAGTARLSGGEVQDAATGFRITDLAGLLRLQGDSLRIEQLNGRAGDGTVAAAGSIGVLAEGMPIDLGVTVQNARLLADDKLTAVTDADLRVSGGLATGLRASGTVRVDRAEIRIPERLPAQVASIELRQPGTPAAAPAPPLTIALDIAVQAPRAVFLRGRGLDAELGGTLQVRGTAAAPDLSGGFDLRRGEFDLAGQVIRFSRGRVAFTGATGLDPSLDLEARTSANGFTAILRVGGTASNPTITLSSEPEAPQDEVLARLLFNRSAAGLSPLQLARLASVAASLAGFSTGAGDPLDSLRRGLGLDRLSVGQGADGSTNVDAGRYVADGVYLGVRQGTEAGQTQGTVQIELTPRLRLEADVGAGSTSGSRAGIAYEFDY